MHSIFGCVDLLLGKEKPEVPVRWGFGLVGEVFLLWQAAKAERRQVHPRRWLSSCNASTTRSLPTT